MAFDPYYTWLAIAPEEQPPNHYRLLGLRLFEENPEVIANAADQRMMHLRNFQAGQHSALSQKLLNEVAAARVCLLNPEKKHGYDEQLRQAVRPVQVEPFSPIASVSKERFPTFPGGSPGGGRSSTVGKRPRSPVGIGLVAAAVGLVLILGAVAVLSSRKPLRTTTEAVERRGSREENLHSSANARESDRIAERSQPSRLEKVASSVDESVASTSPPEPHPPAQREWIDLLKLFDLAEDRVSGPWERNGDKLIGMPEPDPPFTSRARLPVNVEGSYDLEVEFARAEGNGAVALNLPVGTHQCSLIFSHQYNVHGIELIDGESVHANRTTRRPGILVNDHLYLAQVSVRLQGEQSQITVYLDSEPCTNWTGSPHALDLHKSWALGTTGMPGLGLHGSKVVFHAVRLRMVSDDAPLPTIATPVRPPGASVDPLVLKDSKDRANSLSANSDAPRAKDEIRYPVPAEDVQQQITKQLDDVYKLGNKRTQAENLRLAKELLELAEKTKDKLDERYVFMAKASELAADGGDAESMFNAVERLGRQFEIDLLATKVSLLERFAKGDSGGTRVKSVVKESEGLVEQALAEDRYDVAKSLAESVYTFCQRKSEGKAFRKQVYDRRAEVDRMAQVWEGIQQALDSLKTRPDDRDSNRVVGQWYCFAKRDWERGLPHLAKGGDDELGTLAQREMQAQPVTPEDQVKLADAWWSLADKRKGQDAEALTLHAAAWYRKAEPGIRSTLEKTRIAKRLEATDASGRGSESDSKTKGAEKRSILGRATLSLADARLGPIPHDAIKKPVTVNVPYEPQYPGGGPNGLTDGRRAAQPDIDQPWQGYHGTDVIATIDLGQVQQIRCITATFFQAHNYGIFLPSRVEYAVSQDGREYHTLGSLTSEPCLRQQPDACKTFTAAGLQHTARYVRMQATNYGRMPAWQKSPGTPTWLFVDEILVNPVGEE